MKPIGVIIQKPEYPAKMLTRVEGSSLLKEDFSIIIERFRKAFPEARWLSEITPGAWMISADKKEALRTFYLGVGLSVRQEDAAKPKQLALF